MRTRSHFRPLALILALLAGSAQARRPGSDLELFSRLNGVPSRLGVITTTGASTTNATTASAFTITGGSTLIVVCDAAAFVNVGATSSTSYTDTAFGFFVMSAGVPKYIVLRDTDTTLAVASAASVNCVVGQLF